MEKNEPEVCGDTRTRCYVRVVMSADRLVGQASRLDGLGHGAHACWVVDFAEQFNSGAADYFSEGFRLGDKPLWFGPAYADTGPASAAPVTTVDPRVAVLGGGPVDPAAMFARFRREAETAWRDGFDGLRVMADMDWLLAVAPARADLTAFELMLDQVVNELAATVVCAYRSGHFDAQTVTEVAAVHPLTVGRPPAPPGFRIWNHAAATWSVAGEVDAQNGELFGRVVRVAADGQEALWLRVTGLTFVAVAGINAIVGLMEARPELSVTIEGANPLLRQCWELLELDRQLPGVRLLPEHPDGGADGRLPAPTPRMAR